MWVTVVLCLSSYLIIDLFFIWKGKEIGGNMVYSMKSKGFGIQVLYFLAMWLWKILN